MELTISAIITSFATVVSGMILYFVKKHLGKHQEKYEEINHAKARETELILCSLNALGKLTVANSIALRDGKCNGQLTIALEEYEKISKEMYQYLVSFHSQNMSK